MSGFADADASRFPVSRKSSRMAARPLAGGRSPASRTPSSTNRSTSPSPPPRSRGCVPRRPVPRPPPPPAPPQSSVRLPPSLPRLSTTWGSATSGGLFLWPCAPVWPPLQLGVLSFPIGTPIDLGDGGPALPSEVVEHGAPNHRGAPRALHLLVGVEPRQEPFIEGDLGSPSRPRTCVDCRSTSSIDIGWQGGRARDGYSIP